LEGNAPQTLPPSDSRTFDVTIERNVEARAIVDRQRAARVGSGNGAEEQRDVAHGARHRPAGRERRPATGLTRHATGRWTKANDVAEGRRVAQRAAGVAPVGNGHHTAGE